MKSDFHSCQGLVRMGWGPKWECHNPSKFWNRENIWYKSSTKKVLNTLSYFELKKYSCAVSWKVIFSLVKDLFEWVEVLCYWSSMKKVLNTLQISSSKNTLVQFHEKLFSFLSRTCSNGLRSKVGCHNPSRFWNRDNIWYRSSTKKVLNTLSKFELKKYSCAVSWKVIFCLVKDLLNWVEVLNRSVITLVGSETEIIFDIGHLRKKYLARCQIPSSKNTLVQFHEKWFSVLSRTCSNGFRF